nr:PfkB family carbohydrate kinase [Subtercola boreus]
MSSGQILVIGESIVDIVSRDGFAAEHPGGSPLNVAVGLGRLGEDVRLLTSLGYARRGQLIRDHLRRSSVILDPATVTTSGTSTATAVLSENGAASYEFDISWNIPLGVQARPAAIVHTGSLAIALTPGHGAVLNLIQSSRERSLITVDANIRPTTGDQREAQIAIAENFFAETDIVKMSDEDAEWLYPGLSGEDVATRLLAKTAVLVIITRGAAGSTCRASSSWQG